MTFVPFRSRAALAMLALAVALLAGPGTAQAETCNADGSVCLLTETTPEHPATLPATLLIRTGTEYPNVSWRQGSEFGNAFVVPTEPRDPEGWSRENVVSKVILMPQRANGGAGGASYSVPVDGPLTLYVSSRPSYSADQETLSEFTVWVRGAATDMSAAVERRGRFFVGRLTFTGRVPLGASFGVALYTMTSFRCRGTKLCTDFLPLPKTPRLAAYTPDPVAPGHHELTARVPVRRVNRACWYRPPCQFQMEASVYGDTAIFSEIYPGSPGGGASPEFGLFYRKFDIRFKRPPKKRCGGKKQCSSRAKRRLARISSATFVH